MKKKPPAQVEQAWQRAEQETASLEFLSTGIADDTSPLAIPLTGL